MTRRIALLILCLTLILTVFSNGKYPRQIVIGKDTLTFITRAQERNTVRLVYAYEAAKERIASFEVKTQSDSARIFELEGLLNQAQIIIQQYKAVEGHQAYALSEMFKLTATLRRQITILKVKNIGTAIGASLGSAGAGLAVGYIIFGLKK